jgi:hypothetical protein
MADLRKWVPPEKRNIMTSRFHPITSLFFGKRVFYTSYDAYMNTSTLQNTSTLHYDAKIMKK